MVDIPPASERFVESELYQRFDGVGAAIPEVVVFARPQGDSFHIADHQDANQPACRSAGTNYAAVDVEGVISRSRPCSVCFEHLLDYLARQPDSPVQYASETVDTATRTTEVAVDGGVGSAAPPPLTSVTERVLKTSSSGTGDSIAHAPIGDDKPLCGSAGDFSSATWESLKTHYDLCSRCFDTDKIETE